MRFADVTVRVTSEFLSGGSDNVRVLPYGDLPSVTGLDDNQRQHPFSIGQRRPVRCFYTDQGPMHLETGNGICKFFDPYFTRAQLAIAKHRRMS
jgi:hypothetical protein